MTSRIGVAALLLFAVTLAGWGCKDDQLNLGEFNNGRPYDKLPIFVPNADKFGTRLNDPDGEADASGIAEVVRVRFTAQASDLGTLRDVTYRWVGDEHGTAIHGEEFTVRTLGGPIKYDGKLWFLLVDGDYRELPGERYLIHRRDFNSGINGPEILAYAPIDADGRIVANERTEPQGVAGMAAADVLAQAWAGR